MKTVLMFVLCLCMFTGCGGEETMETIADEMVEPAMAQIRQIMVSLPEEAASPTVQDDGGKLYQCDGYEILLQTLDGGDLDATIQSISGYSRDSLTVIETAQGEFTRYEFVWASAGETGERIGRAVILDDGSYHYGVSLLADPEKTAECGQIWDILFASVTLS